jgi:hypothetical protein
METLEQIKELEKQITELKAKLVQESETICEGEINNGIPAQYLYEL